MIGSLASEPFLLSHQTSLLLLSATHDDQQEDETKEDQKGSSQPLLGIPPQILIIQFVNPPDQVGHFFVVCIDFSAMTPDFNVDISFFENPECAQKRIHI